MSPNDFRAVFLPYCLQKQPDGRYAVLNRRYKPVGFQTREYLKYEDYPICVKLKGLRSTNAAKISFDGNPDTDTIYLYNDGCVPTHSTKHMRDYLQRLEMLAALKVEDIIDQQQVQSPLRLRHLLLKEGGLVEVDCPSNPKIHARLGRIAAVGKKTVEVWLRDTETMLMVKYSLELQQVEAVPLENEPGCLEVAQRIDALRGRSLDPFELRILELLEQPVVLTPVELGYLEGIEGRVF
jgi:hypothetical protein